MNQPATGEALATYEVPRHSEPLAGLLTEDNGLQGLVETVRNHVLEAQGTAHPGAQRSERSAERQAYRTGSRPRMLTTRVGPLVLPGPQVRDGSCSPTLFARDQRSEHALILALMEMMRNGVSTRQVAAVTEELCGTRFSRSTVSQLCMALDARA